MIAGLHSVSESSDLLENYDFHVSQMAATLAASTKPDAALSSDFAAFQDKWNKVKTAERTRMGMLLFTNPIQATTSVGRSLIPNEVGYQAITKAWSPTYPLYTDQDGPGLRKRIVAATGDTTLGANTTAPKFDALDVDLKLYQASDSAIKTGQQASANFLQDNYGKLAIGAIGLVGTLVVLRKLRLL